jgi:hypothetical protein
MTIFHQKTLAIVKTVWSMNKPRDFVHYISEKNQAALDYEASDRWRTGESQTALVRQSGE